MCNAILLLFSNMLPCVCCSGTFFPLCVQSSLYWSDASVELMFHVVTRMPTKIDVATGANDVQQIDKKRHIGCVSR